VVGGNEGRVVGGTVACVVVGTETGAAVVDGSVSGGVLVGTGVTAICDVVVGASDTVVDTTGRGGAGLDGPPLNPTAAPTMTPTAMTPSVDPMTTIQGSFLVVDSSSGSSSKSGARDRNGFSPSVGSSSTRGAYPSQR
jgi:hypothetical protein